MTFKELREKTGCGMIDCIEALDYAKGDIKIAIAYVKAKTLAIKTPTLTFDERVEKLMED